MIFIDQIKQLREETGVSPTEIKKALEETKGDVEKAKELLRIRGKAILNKKSSRETKLGLIETPVSSLNCLICSIVTIIKLFSDLF